jgi:hypothetical protein
MYPDNFDRFNLTELGQWRSTILAAKQKAEDQAMDARIALKKVEAELKKRGKN